MTCVIHGHEGPGINTPGDATSIRRWEDDGGARESLEEERRDTPVDAELPRRRRAVTACCEPLHLGARKEKSAMPDRPSSDKTKQQIRHLRELIAALDKRQPQIERVGEADIARDAAALRKKALQRIAELQGDVALL